MMLQPILSRLRHHSRSLRILNGFSFRWHRRTVNTQGARPRIVRRVGIQGRDVHEILGPLNQLIHDGVSCASLSTFSTVSGSLGSAATIASPLSEPLIEFGGRSGERTGGGGACDGGVDGERIGEGCRG